MGENAIEMVQAVAVAIAGGLRVDNRAKVPLSPTYAGILARAAFRAAQQICPGFGGPKQPSTVPG